LRGSDRLGGPPVSATVLFLAAGVLIHARKLQCVRAQDGRGQCTQQRRGGLLPESRHQHLRSELSCGGLGQQQYWPPAAADGWVLSIICQALLGMRYLRAVVHTGNQKMGLLVGEKGNLVVVRHEKADEQLQREEC